jgi:TolB-like protein
MSPGSDKAALPDASAFRPDRRDDRGTASLLASTMSSALGDRLEILRTAGQGGSSVVFLAQERQTSRQIALKVLRPELSAAFDAYRFQREIEIARRLKHPNILPIFESGSAESNLYFTMPFVNGGTLRARLQKEPQVPIPDALRIAREVASALDYAHAAGVIHRDVKPANILLDGLTALVADFGIARAITVASGDAITESGVTVGTPEYMSPEHGLGEKDLGASSDIYALGCVVYEMLAGEPPFTGPTAQAIVARHCREAPRSLRIVRPAVPYGVQRAVEKALAKTPVDRFSTAGAFVDALEEGLSIQDEPRRWRLFWTKKRIAITTGFVTAALVGTPAVINMTRPEPQANRVVVFPLYDAEGPAGSTDADGVATYIGNALGNARPLTWVDGWELLDEDQRNTRLAARQARRLALRSGARYYIDGAILRDHDSVRVLLTLHDALVDSVAGSGTTAAAASTAVLPVLGVRAAAQLLPSIVQPGGTLALRAMAERNPRAIANFLQGERAYRRMQFVTALGHYQLALGEDSALTMAAVRAAHAANWSKKRAIALRLADVAVRGAGNLPPAQAQVAIGLRFMLEGVADSAIAHLMSALRQDPGVHGAWTLLGETYLRLLPSAGPADSLARAALESARAEDRDFSPTLLLLETLALNAGRLRDAAAVREDLRRAGADTSHALSRSLTLRCVRDGPSSVDFHAALRADTLAVISAAKMLDGAARQPACAIAAYSAILDAADVEPGYRWAAFLGLQAQFAATDRPTDARALFEWRGAEKLPLRFAYLIVAEAGSGFAENATAIADTAFRQGYDRLPTIALWLTGNWETRRNNADRVRQISQVLNRKADSSKSRLAKLAARAIAARVRLVERDTAGAIAAIRALAPTAPVADISWVAWESLASERMLLAELLLARKDYAGARRIATLLEAPEPVIYPLYLRRSLELRTRAAEAEGQPGLAAAYRRRISELSRQ